MQSPPFRSHACALVALLLLTATSHADTRPNFVFIIADDIGHNDLGCYGSLNGGTPHLDALASEGMLFTNAYLTASSCSPSRSSIITGRYPHNNGEAAELHRFIPWHLPSMPGALRDAGYYTALSGKNHMTWYEAPAGKTAPTPPFDKIGAGKSKANSGGHANWVQTLQECPTDKPFFLWLAANDAHRNWDADRQWDEAAYGPKHNPDDVVLPPAFIDTPTTRSDFASYLNEVTRFDHFVGATVDQLKEQEVWNNTYVFVVSDNGRPFPRGKTRLNDDGMQTYFIAAGKTITDPGSKSHSLVSVIDIAPTVAELAGVSTPETFQGRSLVPVLSDPSATIRPLAFSEHNWHDYEALGRAVRDGRWLYVQNDRPELASQGPADSVRSASHQDLRTADASGIPLSPVQADVLRAPRPNVELYDTQGDPYQIHNLAGQPEYSAIEIKLREALAFWRDKTGDSSPSSITPDTFDRDTGESLGLRKKLGKEAFDQFKQPPPGHDRGAERINDEGLLPVSSQ